jgi:hypothetical protein
MGWLKGWKKGMMAEISILEVPINIYAQVRLCHTLPVLDTAEKNLSSARSAQHPEPHRHSGGLVYGK